ncbi:MAG: FAD-binding domain-containing protein [Gammaproteobacteria bacterium]|nr:FAD-binding domain-containing protein [Gammaproteobacteria bacterium]
MVNIFWFKRDLRVHDNPGLSLAGRTGQLLPLYIFDPDQWVGRPYSARHYQFLCDSVEDLRVSLLEQGHTLVFRVGNPTSILSSLFQEFDVGGLWASQEVGDRWARERDRRVIECCLSYGVRFEQAPQNGVIQRLSNRDTWSKRWHNFMLGDVVTLNAQQSGLLVRSDARPCPSHFGLSSDHNPNIQRGGRARALELLSSFKKTRGQYYSREMSSPVTAFESCSRLSPHFAFGTVSVREVYQNIQRKMDQLLEDKSSSNASWARSMSSFASRLRWHCHFMQKFNDEPRMEFENLHRGTLGLRGEGFDEVFFEAWKQGRTGFPLVDAAMRALKVTGWINFRMRAMLISFASYHLWLHWVRPAEYLASLFTDFEPGIHYPQVQMQAGTTGINAIRIYSPTKQARDQDPEGVFIREWIPELCATPKSFIHTPWINPMVESGYPSPIVEESNARKVAAEKMHALRKTIDFAKESKGIFEKHGSRSRARKKVFIKSPQLELL